MNGLSLRFARAAAVVGVGTLLALMFTDFGLLGAALAAISTAVAVLGDTRRRARRLAVRGGR